jgi:CHASE2 domain-containing sensor protein
LASWFRSSLKRAFWNKGTISVLVIVLLGTYLYHLEGTREQFPFVVTMQLKLHQALSRMLPRVSDVKFVLPVEIDDAAYWNPPLSGRVPTNRRYLGEVALAAAEAGAAVVAIDFRLTTPSLRELEDDESRREENEFLLEAIRRITARGVPVVLTYFLVDNGRGEWVRYPNIFPDEVLPAGVYLGHLNLPRDKRQIPLQMPVRQGEDAPLAPVDSFAMQMVAAYEEATGKPAKTISQPAVAAALEAGEFLYGGFFRREDFAAITSGRLLAGDEVAKRRCRHRIAIVGATWHEAGENVGNLIESFPSPVGNVPGLFLHANYVEALLDGRFHRGAPLWSALLLDLLFGFALYFSYHSVRGRALPLIILAIFLLPLLASYFVFANLGIYLDSVPPLGLCFVHLGYEYVQGLRHEAAGRTRQ